MDKATEAKLLDFIRKELPPFIVRNSIPAASYIVEWNSTDESHLSPCKFQDLNLRFVLERLLQITLIQEPEEAVSAFDRCCCPEGTHGFFQDAALLEGIHLEKEIPVFEGVRLVPLPSLEISNEVCRYLPSFPSNPSSDPKFDFLGKTLLVVDRPGLSIFHEALDSFLRGLPVDDLPFQMEVRDVKFPNSKAVNSFRNLFCHALSLICDYPVQIVSKGWFLAEDKSFNYYGGTINRHNYPSSFSALSMVGEAEIDEAKCLYKKLIDLEPGVKAKLRIAIDRWIKSKASGSYVDKMIDLRIALEALYVTSKDDIGKKLRHRASWYLGENPADQQELETEFEAIYNYRSKAVHGGKLDKEVKIQGQRMPISEFIESVQDRCRRSILEIIKDGQFPDWNTLRQRAKARWANS